MSRTHTYRDFFTALLTALGLPVRTAGLRSMACVNLYENPEGNLRWNNPLACSRPSPGSTPLYPDVEGPCAQIYPTFRAGVRATATMYSEPHWAGVRSALNDYSGRARILDAFRDAYTWPVNNPHFDFRHSAYNTIAMLDSRLASRLYGPGD